MLTTIKYVQPLWIEGTGTHTPFIRVVAGMSQRFEMNTLDALPRHFIPQLVVWVSWCAFTDEVMRFTSSAFCDATYYPTVKHCRKRDYPTTGNDRHSSNPILDPIS